MSTFSPAYPALDRERADDAPRVPVRRIALGNADLPADERLNQITHGIGFVLALIASGVLIAATPFVDDVRAIGAIVYAIALSGLYLSSTLSHSFLDRNRRSFWRAADQIAILGMTVGSFVPFALVHVATPFGWTLLAITSIAAAVLSIIRIVRWEAGVSVFAMVCVGLLPALATYQMIQVGGVYGTALLAAGTGFYVGGLWFLMNDNRKMHYHAIWHLATIAGSGCHFLFVYFWCIVDAV